MAEINLVDGTIFVDVSAGQSYPIQFTQPLLTATPETANDAGLQNDLTSSNSQEKPGEAQKVLSEKQTTAEDTDNPCLQIQKRRIRCPECQRFTAETEEKMQRHIRRVHRGENPFQCYMCDYSTYNKAVFEEHVRVHQGIKPFKCPQCPYRSASKKNAKKHELIHRLDNPLRCTDCGFIARNPKGLGAHKKMHDEEDIKIENQSYSCKHCKFESDSMQNLRSHTKCRSHCKDCDFVSCSRTVLRRHMVNVHNRKPVISRPKTKSQSKLTQTMFKCALCDWKSNNKPRILLHLIHHPNQTVDETQIDISILKEYNIM